MAVMKKLLFTGIGLVAITGIGAGIGVGINNSRVVENSMNKTESKPSEGNKNPEISIQPAMVDLQKIVNQIQPENIVFKKKEESTPVAMAVAKNSLTSSKFNDGRKDVYAFDVSATELDFDEQTKKKLEESKVKVEIKLNNNINNGVELNEGKLILNLVGSFKDKKEEVAEVDMMQMHQITIGGFKTASAELTKLFKKEENSKLTILDLTTSKKQQNQIALTTIETLNKTEQVPSTPLKGRSGIKAEEAKTVSGLTKLFRVVNEKDNDDGEEGQETPAIKSISLSGTVKLAKITKGEKDQNTLFHLVNANANKQLELVNEITKDKALVNEIVVTNLLASNIKLDVVRLEEIDQTKFDADFKKEAKTKMYEYDDKKDQNVSLKIKKTSGGEDDYINVLINPILLRRTAKDQDIKANLTISYGTDKNSTKTYSTTNTKDVEEIKASGINFSVYSKKIEGEDKVVKADAISNANNKLDSFFNKETATKGVEKKTLHENMKPNNPIAGFKLVSLDNNKFDKDFVIGKVTATKKAPKPKAGRADNSELDTQQDTWINENWISFVGYTFNEGLKDKVLFVPTINLIHITEIKGEIPLDGAETAK